MGALTLDDISVFPLKRIDAVGGHVMHGLKCSDKGFVDFGEAYFSWVLPSAIKAWKLHRKMTLNLIVPIGAVRFVFYLPEFGFREETIGEEGYARICVPPSIWFGFQGYSEKPSLLLNIANIEHDPMEVERKDISEIHFNW